MDMIVFTLYADLRNDIEKNPWINVKEYLPFKYQNVYSNF